MLPVSYHHAVFTLPNEIFPLCLYNQKLIYDLLFHSSAETLKAFGNDPLWLGAVIGFFGILHTWGQLLPMHPHVHYVIPAGGINPETGEWVNPNGPLPASVKAFLQMAGDVYFPFLLANAAAFDKGQETFSLTLLGEHYEQGTFKYQVKCLNWLREEYAGLKGEVKERTDSVLKETGCFEPLQG